MDLTEHDVIPMIRVGSYADAGYGGLPWDVGSYKPYWNGYNKRWEWTHDGGQKFQPISFRTDDEALTHLKKFYPDHRIFHGIIPGEPVHSSLIKQFMKEAHEHLQAPETDVMHSHDIPPEMFLMKRAIKLPKRIKKLKPGVRAHPDAEPAVTQYAARGGWRPAEAWWMAPDGTIHELNPVQTHESWLRSNFGPEFTQEHAFKAGWLRLQKDLGALLVSNYHKDAPTPAQLAELKDHIKGRGINEIHYYGPGSETKGLSEPRLLWPVRRGPVGPDVYRRHPLPPRKAVTAMRFARFTLGQSRPWRSTFGGQGVEHDYHDEAGNKAGVIRVQERNDGEMLHVHWAGPTDAKGGDPEAANRSGVEAMRSLHEQLAAAYPNAKYLSGVRAGGPKKGQRVVVPLRKTRPGLPKRYAGPGEMQPHEGGRVWTPEKGFMTDKAAPHWDHFNKMSHILSSRTFAPMQAQSRASATGLTFAVTPEHVASLQKEGKLRKPGEAEAAIGTVVRMPGSGDKDKHGRFPQATHFYHPSNFEGPAKLRRRLPKRYAKVDGHEPAHHLIAGFPIEHALRHLANDPKNNDALRNVAKIALTGKNPVDGSESNPSEALFMLHDLLNEHANEDGSYGHPLRAPSEGGHGYNWMSAADKIHLDSHTYTALSEEAERMRKDHNQPHTMRTHWQYRPEGLALTLGRINRNSATEPARRSIDERYDRVIDRVKKLSKVDDEALVHESLKRHAVRAAMEWRKDHGVSHGTDVTESIDPPRSESEYYGPMPREKVTRYAAKGDRGYSWMTPGGKYHPVVGMDTHDKIARRLGFKDGSEGAFKDGWLRVVAMGNTLYVMNPYRVPNSKQKSQLIDHAIEERHDAVVHDNEKTSRVLWDAHDRLARPGRPIKKSMAVRGDFIDSLRRIRSSNIETLNRTANAVAKRLGLHPVKTYPALHDTRHGSVPGLAQAVYGLASPEQIHTAAAWIGSVGNLPGVMVHHVRPGGPDTLYKFRQTGSGLDIRHKLDRAGLTDRIIMIPPGDRAQVGFDIMIPDRGNKLGQAVAQYVQANKLKVEASPGHIKTLGSRDQGQARETYRNTIARGERMARKGGVRRYAVPANWYPGRKGVPHEKLLKWLTGVPQGGEVDIPAGMYNARVTITNGPDNTVIIKHAGDPALTAHPDGSYTIHKLPLRAGGDLGYYTPDDHKKIINQFIGTNAATVKRRTVHINGKPLAGDVQMRSQDRHLADLWNQIIGPRGEVRDQGLALQLADSLMDKGDWRHHILRKLADPTWDRTGHERPDGTAHRTPSGSDYPVRYPSFHLDPEEATNIRNWHKIHSFPTQSGSIRLGYNPKSASRPTILVRTSFATKGEPKSSKIGHAVFTPEEYEEMRQEAAGQGVTIHQPPESHRPKPQEPTAMKRKVKVCRSDR